MNYWVYNITDKHSVLKNEIVNEYDILTATIEVEDFNDAIGTSKTDYILTLNKNGQYYFNHYGKVSGEVKTMQIDLNSEDVKKFEKRYNSPVKYPKKYRHIVPTTLHTIHENLEDYLYSLVAVENYSSPQKHFQRKYTRLSEEDYKTITEKLLYIARTVFGRLINCLPRDNKFEVLLGIMEEEGTNDIRQIGYLKATGYLKAFIENTIVDTGQYILGLEKLITQNFSAYGVNWQSLGLANSEDLLEGISNLSKSRGVDAVYDTENLKIDSLSKQAVHFKMLFSLDYDLSLVDELGRQIELNQEIEIRFEKLFNRRRWPLNIII